MRLFGLALFIAIAGFFSVGLAASQTPTQRAAPVCPPEGRFVGDDVGYGQQRATDQFVGDDVDFARGSACPAPKNVQCAALFDQLTIEANNLIIDITGAGVAQRGRSETARADLPRRAAALSHRLTAITDFADSTDFNAADWSRRSEQSETWAPELRRLRADLDAFVTRGRATPANRRELNRIAQAIVALDRGSCRAT